MPCLLEVGYRDSSAHIPSRGELVSRMRAAPQMCILIYLVALIVDENLHYSRSHKLALYVADRNMDMK